MYRAQAAAYIGVLVKGKLSIDEVGEQTSTRLGIKLKDGQLYTVQHKAVHKAVQTANDNSHRK
jgi:hypothetical protein